jgi:cobalt-precorrin-5B (C1)-methyltransferase
MSNSPRSGYTLPVFACAAAIAALRWLQEDLKTLRSVSVRLLEPNETVEIPVEQVARLNATSALAVTRSDPGDNLDLTRNTPVWAWVEWGDPNQSEAIAIQGGEGIGQRIDVGQAAIYAYAHRLFQENLRIWLPPQQTIRVTLLLPEGRALAERTSNAAFGVVEGLSLLGTSGIAQPLSAPGQLALFQETLRQKAEQYDCLVFCLGENGLDLAPKIGIPSDRLVKTANWLGSMLVEAGILGVANLLLFGYHGKLIKLAGGIFHTHHHVADGRQEILAAHCANQGLPTADVQAIFTSPTTEAALQKLRQLDTAEQDWVNRIYGAIAQQIDCRAQAYIQTHSERLVTVGSVLFDRDRKIVICSEIGRKLLTQICYLG